LPKSDHLSIVGKPQAPASEQPQTEAKTENAPATTGEASNEAKTASTEKTPASKAPEDEASKQTAWKQWGDKIRSQQQQIDLLSRELDVLQREYQIRAAAMYADAGNRLRNQADWDKQDTQYKQQIADKQKAVDEAKQKLEELQENARKAGAPTSVQEQ
jgi:predicted RNase H-like nuclease (RuvC/YqgF family)